MLSYDSPAVLNMLNDPGSGMGGVGMGITMSGLGMSGLGMSSLGMSASAMGRADEAERSRRLQNILEVVGAKPGRVSEDGLLALCKKLGVQVEKNTAEAHSWMLLIGDEAVCDITFKNDEIASVNLQTGLDGEQEHLQFGPTGSQILVRSLKPLPGQSKINVTLERFSENLEKLLTLDKLSAPQNGGVSCYNAIAGVYTSLRKLFEHEKKIAMAVMDANTPNLSIKAEREVLCRKSGRPRLNGGSCLGLSLEYWMDRRYLNNKKAPATRTDKGKEKMEIDSEPEFYPEDNDPELNSMYSLTIECESSPSTLYNPIRISNEWISDKVEKPTDANDANVTIDNILMDKPSIDWQDPKPTYLEAAEPSGEAMDISSTPGRLPNIRFVARFNPPLVVPLAVHIQLYQSVGIEPRPEDFRPTTFVGLALRPGEIDPGMMGATETTHEIRSSRSVLCYDDNGQEKQQEHDMSLYLSRMEYSRTLESLPFSHPKQLVEMLPTLRQYALTTSLLKDSFYKKPSKPSSISQPSPSSKPPTTTTTALEIDINLTYTPPSPRLVLSIPHPTQSSQSLLLTLDIHPNAALSLPSQNLIPISASHTTPSLLHTATKPAADDDASIDGVDEVGADDRDVETAANDRGGGKGGQAEGEEGEGEGEDVMHKAELVEAKVKRVVDALDIVGDLGVWCEWVRREVRRGKAG